MEFVLMERKSSIDQHLDLRISFPNEQSNRPSQLLENIKIKKVFSYPES
jgi:hypothetical protein